MLLTKFYKSIVLTASTDELRAFFKEHQENEDAFATPVVFERID